MSTLAAQRQLDGGDKMDLARKKDMILEHESGFAAAVGSAVIEKPKASCWIILLPFMFIFLIHDMHRFKRHRRKFKDEFMIDRHRAMAAALEAAVSGSKPTIDWIVEKYEEIEALKGPYKAWIEVLADHYMDLLLAAGENFESLVRGAYRKRTNYLLILNRLNTVENEFLEALKGSMKAVEGASDVIAPGICRTSFCLTLAPVHDAVSFLDV
jgi:hypothetical protein